jgi:hypothetical protein
LGRRGGVPWQTGAGGDPGLLQHATLPEHLETSARGDQHRKLRAQRRDLVRAGATEKAGRLLMSEDA